MGDQFVDPDRGGFEPALDGDDAVAHVGAEDHPFAVAGEPAGEYLRLQGGHAADDGVRGARREDGLQGCVVLDAAAPFEFAGYRLGNLLERLEVVGRARAGPVQVDEVDALHAAVGIAAGQVRRVAVIHFLLAVVAARQSHAASVDEVDGRDDADHKARKFWRIAAPVEPLFSG